MSESTVNMAVMDSPPFLTLPSELINHILSYLPLSDLLSIGLANRALQEHSQQDTLYQSFVQENVPSSTVPIPADLSWRELYALHHPYWFIPKNKIWFADNAHMGKLLIARYDHRINAIEAYALGAERRQPTFQTWDWNPDAIIHTFNPRIQLDLNKPVLHLDATGYEGAVGDAGRRLQKEIPMNLTNESSPTGGLFSRLMLARPWPKDIITEATPIWPPLTLPSEIRTRSDSATQFRDTNNRPSVLSELSTSNFRLRKWMEFSSRVHGMDVRVGEEITTWGTLPEECYTPTARKPWQGIWVGDYAGHGCEFLAIMQPDDPKPLPERAEWVMSVREHEDNVSSTGSWSTAPMDATEWNEAFHEPETLSPYANANAMAAAYAIANANGSGSANSGASTSLSTTYPANASSSTSKEKDADEDSIYQGRIEAVKLTGDPNIPRGEFTFIAPDIGPNGLIRVATEDMFKGAHIVESVGHIAARGFRDGKQICQNRFELEADAKY
jgi:hypothetical protein